VYVELLKNPGESWCEYWYQGEVQIVIGRFQEIVELGLIGWSSGDQMVWQGTLNADGGYTPRGLIYYECEQRRVQAVIAADSSIAGEYTIKRTGAVFEGSLDGLTPGVGRMREEVEAAVLEGQFSEARLEGVGRAVYEMEGIAVEGVFAAGRKAGLCRVLGGGRLVFVGEYAGDAKEGFGLRVYGEGRGQLFEFGGGRVATAWAAGPAGDYITN
jgi:hypothetical protein